MGWIVVLAALSAPSLGAAQGNVPVVEQEELPPAEAAPPPAQQPPPAQPPPGYQPQPQAPGYAQPGYGQQPGYRGRRQRIEYREGMQIPPDGEVVTRPRFGMLIPGIAIFGVSYIGTVAAWAMSKDSGGRVQDIVAVPLVGPYIAAARAGSRARKIGAACMAVMQTAGLALLIGGLVPKKYLVYYADGWELRPRAGLGGAGLDLSLRF